MAYAKGTDVSVEKSEAEIKATIRRYGATSFGSFEEPGGAMIQMPDGTMFGAHAKVAIAKSYETGTMQPLLPPPAAIN